MLGAFRQALLSPAVEHSTMEFEPMAHPAPQHYWQVVINDRTLEANDAELTGRDVLALGGFRPASDYSTIVYTGLGTQALGLDESIRINVEQPPVLRIFEGDRLFRALLNEREIVWGRSEITAAELRIIGQVPDDQDLFLDSHGDRSIPDDGSVHLRREGVERIRSGDPEDRAVDVILNGEKVTVQKGRLSFAELTKLAFPGLFGRDQVCFTVSFSRGPKRRREGVLLEGGKIRVVEGMVFNVSATDKS